MKNSKQLLALILFILVFLGIGYVIATPVAPTITPIGNTTKSAENGTKMNGTSETAGSTEVSGGYIFTVNLNAFSQTSRWKAYVGNVTGTFVLDDADGYTIYSWSATGTVSGEVYATRTSGSVTWADINCSTSVNITNEEIVLNHTSNPSDNISTTFDAQDNNEFYVGSVKINASTCYTTNLFLNDSAPIADQWEEVLLHDKDNMIYTSIISDNTEGYRDDAPAGNKSTTYDFQMILPERGYDGWSSSTAYYFFVELT